MFGGGFGPASGGGVGAVCTPLGPASGGGWELLVQCKGLCLGGLGGLPWRGWGGSCFSRVGGLPCRGWELLVEFGALCVGGLGPVSQGG